MILRLSTLALALMAPLALFADATPQPPVAPDTSFIQTAVMLGLGMLFFYFILMRPEQQKRKELDQAKEKMKTGDRVIALGIIGTVHKIQKETVVLKMYDEGKIEVLKTAISEVLPPTAS